MIFTIIITNSNKIITIKKFHRKSQQREALSKYVLRLSLKFFTATEEGMLLGREFHNEVAALLNALSLYVVVFYLRTYSRFADEHLSYTHYARNSNSTKCIWIIKATVVILVTDQFY